jgi:hypothetical protein
MIEVLRSQIRAAIRAHDMDQAHFLVRMVVLLRAAKGEIYIQPRPLAEILARTHINGKAFLKGA